jgi:hypothetical protein
MEAIVAKLRKLMDKVIERGTVPRLATPPRNKNWETVCQSVLLRHPSEVRYFAFHNAHSIDSLQGKFKHVFQRANVPKEILNISDLKMILVEILLNFSEKYESDSIDNPLHCFRTEVGRQMAGIQTLLFGVSVCFQKLDLPLLD